MSDKQETAMCQDSLPAKPTIPPAQPTQLLELPASQEAHSVTTYPRQQQQQQGPLQIEPDSTEAHEELLGELKHGLAVAIPLDQPLDNFNPYLNIQQTPFCGQLLRPKEDVDEDASAVATSRRQLPLNDQSSSDELIEHLQAAIEQTQSSPNECQPSQQQQQAMQPAEIAAAELLTQMQSRSMRIQVQEPKAARQQMPNVEAVISNEFAAAEHYPSPLRMRFGGYKPERSLQSSVCDSVLLSKSDDSISIAFSTLLFVGDQNQLHCNVLLQNKGV